jgi:hypothetical protein
MPTIENLPTVKDEADIEFGPIAESEKTLFDMQNALWLIEVLISEHKLTTENTVTEFMKILKEEKKNYEANLEVARRAQGDSEAINSFTGQEESKEGEEFRAIAGEESEKAERVIKYCNEALELFEKIRGTVLLDDNDIGMAIDILSKIVRSSEKDMEKEEDVEARMQSEEVRKWENINSSPEKKNHPDIY